MGLGVQAATAHVVFAWTHVAVHARLPSPEMPQVGLAAEQFAAAAESDSFPPLLPMKTSLLDTAKWPACHPHSGNCQMAVDTGVPWEPVFQLLNSSSRMDSRQLFGQVQTCFALAV